MTIIEFWGAVRDLPSGTEVFISYNEEGPCPVTEMIFKESCFKCEGRRVIFGSPTDHPCPNCKGTGKKPNVVLS